MLIDLVFLLFVAVAVFTQNVTGFALALVLLSLVGATDLMPLPDAVNAVTVIGIVNTGYFLYKRRALRLARPLWPALATSLAGTAMGVVALMWLAGSAYHLLGLLLGLGVVYYAVILWRAVEPLPQASPRRAFLWIGWLSGLMGGLFAAPGPPLVYQLYRQPWPMAHIQESLMYLVGVGSVLRLLMVWWGGDFSMRSFQLALMAVPVVFVVTWWTVRRPLRLSPTTMRHVVCCLLALAGGTMAYQAVSAHAFSAG